jgi:hypothetical protein
VWQRELSSDDPVTRRVARNGLSIPITDYTHAFDTITFIPPSGSGTVLHLTLSLDTLLHTQDRDLIISLVHAGVRDTLVNRVGGEGQNFISTTLDDDATMPLWQGFPPFTGVFQPYQALSCFAGLPPDGDWILEIYDAQAGNTGVLRGWSMTVAFGGGSGAAVQVALDSGWNLVSLPVSNPLPDDSVRHLYAHSAFHMPLLSRVGTFSAPRWLTVQATG